MKRKIVKLDVREHIQQGREPFPAIMQTVMGLKSNESLLLLAPFKPAPLLEVMAGHGFNHTAVETALGDWEILFEKPDASQAVLKTPSPPPCPKRAKLSK